jgi:GT2 family glycosyltransferase
MELSVIIVSFNVKDYLQKCLHSVRAAVENTEHEIFVVDNNSGDGSAEMVKREFPDIKLIANQLNSGFSKANNQAIKNSAGRFILLLNPDTIVKEDTFRKCIEFMNFHPDAGAVGVRMTDGEGKFLPESKRAFPTVWTAFFKTSGLSYLFPRSPLINRYYLPQINMMETSVTEVISGAFMFLRRDALNKSGLLDEDFFMYGEDIDLSYRLLQTCYRNYYFPLAEIVHFKGRSTDREGYKDILCFYKAMRIYIKKRATGGTYRSLQFLLTAATWLRELLALLSRTLRLIFRR